MTNAYSANITLTSEKFRLREPPAQLWEDTLFGGELRICITRESWGVYYIGIGLLREVETGRMAFCRVAARALCSHLHGVRKLRLGLHGKIIDMQSALRFILALPPPRSLVLSLGHFDGAVPIPYALVTLVE